MSSFQTLSAAKITWYHSSVPLDDEDIKFLSEKFSFLEHHLVSTEQGKTLRPKIYVSRKYLHFVFHIPYQIPKSLKFNICDLNIFLTKSAFITVESQGNLTGLAEYFHAIETNKRLLVRRFKLGTPNLCINLLKKILNNLESALDKQGELVDDLNKQIFANQKVAAFIEQVSILRYNQVLSYSALERQSRMVDGFNGEKHPFKYFKDVTEHKWQTIVDQFQTLAYELSADVDHLEGLVKTFETLVTHRTNETIKILTIFSVVLLPLTLLSGIYGMNFSYLPLASHPQGFWAILLIMVLVLSGLLWFFRLRKWL